MPGPERDARAEESSESGLRELAAIFWTIDEYLRNIPNETAEAYRKGDPKNRFRQLALGRDGPAEIGQRAPGRRCFFTSP